MLFKEVIAIYSETWNTCVQAVGKIQSYIFLKQVVYMLATDL